MPLPVKWGDHRLPENVFGELRKIPYSECLAPGGRSVSRSTSKGRSPEGRAVVYSPSPALEGGLGLAPPQVSGLFL